MTGARKERHCLLVAESSILLTTQDMRLENSDSLSPLPSSIQCIKHVRLNNFKKHFEMKYAFH